MSKPIQTRGRKEVVEQVVQAALVCLATKIAEVLWDAGRAAVKNALQSEPEVLS